MIEKLERIETRIASLKKDLKPLVTEAIFLLKQADPADMNYLPFKLTSFDESYLVTRKSDGQVILIAHDLDGFSINILDIESCYYFLSTTFKRLGGNKNVPSKS
jgi:hypothetical protein